MTGQQDTNERLRQLHAELVDCGNALRNQARLQDRAGSATLHIAAEHIDRAVEAIACRIEEDRPPN